MRNLTEPRVAEDAASGGPSPRVLLLCVTSAEEAREGLAQDLDTLPPAPFGERGAIVNADPLLAVVAPVPSGGALERPGVADLVAYNRLIESVHGRCTAIPVRFGSVFSDEAGLRAHLLEHAAAYLRLLAELRGSIEVCVRLQLPAPAPPSTSDGSADASATSRSGAAYLRARQAQLALARQQEALVAREGEWLRSALAGLVRACRIEPAVAVARSDQKPALSVSCLLDRGALDALRQRVRELTSESGRALSLHGPFPPYSFVQLPSAPGTPEARPGAGSDSGPQTRDDTRDEARAEKR